MPKQKKSKPKKSAPLSLRDQRLACAALAEIVRQMNELSLVASALLVLLEPEPRRRK